MDLDSTEPSTSTIKYNGTINKFSLIEESFSLKVVTSKSKKKSQRNVSDNKSSNEPLSEDPGPTANVDERFNNLENKFNKRFDELDRNLKTILKILNNPK